jgi:hypothetical protein
MHSTTDLLLITPLLIGGLANLLFPKQVMATCQAIDRLFPFPNVSPFQGSVAVIRISGAIAVSISTVCLLLVVMR